MTASDKKLSQREASLSKEKLPAHVAIIMDGNGRWAKKRFLPRVAGHAEGVKRVEPIVTCAARIGIKALTLYSFSLENWKRPEEEINALMKLLNTFLEKKEKLIMDENIRFMTIGRTEQLPASCQKRIEHVRSRSSNNTGMILNLALAYGGQDEICFATQRIAEQAEKGEISASDVTPELISRNLMTHNMPELDLLIRTSGEYRISNFLLWQSAYAEFFFTNAFWPDFKEENFLDAIEDYQTRNRRFGMTDEQIS